MDSVVLLPDSIKALEKALDNFIEGKEEHDDRVELSKAARQLLHLTKGIHKTMVLVPKIPTDAMLDKGEFVNSEWLNDNAPLGQSSYRDPAKAVYKTMIQLYRNTEKI